MVVIKLFVSAYTISNAVARAIPLGITLAYSIESNSKYLNIEITAKIQTDI